jgi:hypothetical protein
VVAVVGVKVSAMVQLALTARVDPQVVVWPKAPAPVPVMLIPVMERLAVPLLVTVRVWDALAVFTVEVKLSGPVGPTITLGEGEVVPADPVVQRS